MSILLDALKKSEAQHRLGNTPTLQTPVPSGDSNSDVGRVWVPAAMLLLTAGVITWIVLVQYSRPEPSGRTVAVPALVSSPNEDDIHLPVASDSDSASLAKTPVMDFAVPDIEQIASNTQKERNPTGPDAKINDIGDDHTSLSAYKPESEIVLQPDAAIIESERASVNATMGTAHSVRKERGHQAASQPFEAAAISYWQLPQSLRDNFSEIHITVLVYAQNPEERFLLINGERMREKDELDSGLMLEEIKRDRAIFTYQKYRFHLKS